MQLVQFSFFGTSGGLQRVWRARVWVFKPVSIVSESDQIALVSDVDGRWRRSGTISIYTAILLQVPQDIGWPWSVRRRTGTNIVAAS